MDKKVHEDLVKLPFIKKVTEFDKGGKRGEIAFKFRNGTSVVALINEVSEANKYHAMVHGISQRLGDSYAGLSITNDFSGAFDGLQNLIGQLATDEWSSGREGFGGSSDLIQAVANVLGKAVEDVQATWDTLNEAQRKTWGRNNKVKVELHNIKLERLKGTETDGEAIAGF